MNNSLNNHTVVNVTDVITADCIPTSEISISSSNKRKALNDISTISSHSSKVKSSLINNDIAPVYQIIQLVMPDKIKKTCDTKKTNRAQVKSTAINSDPKEGLNDVKTKKMGIEKKKKKRLSPEEYEVSQLKMKWDKLKIKKKKARQRKRLKDKRKIVNGCVNNETHPTENTTAKSVQVPKNWCNISEKQDVHKN